MKRKIFNFITWIIIIGLMIIWLIDFFNIKKLSKPQLCIKTEKKVEVKYNNNTYKVNKCIGAGYNAYYSDEFHAFVPFFKNFEK